MNKIKIFLGIAIIFFAMVAYSVKVRAIIIPLDWEQSSDGTYVLLNGPTDIGATGDRINAGYFDTVDATTFVGTLTVSSLKAGTIAASPFYIEGDSGTTTLETFPTTSTFAITPQGVATSSASFVITTGGKIGIGTTTPNWILSVNDATNGFAVDTSGNVVQGGWASDIIADAYITKTGAWTGTFDGNNIAGGAVGISNLLYASANGELAATSTADLKITLKLDAVENTAISTWAGSANILTVGALDAGSITSNFGTINTGASAITTTGLITGGTLSVTNATTTGQYITGLATPAGAFLAVDTTGQVIATTTPSGGGGADQTPWAENIDAATFNLSNLGITTMATTTPKTGKLTMQLDVDEGIYITVPDAATGSPKAVYLEVEDGTTQPVTGYYMDLGDSTIPHTAMTMTGGNIELARMGYDPGKGHTFEAIHFNYDEEGDLTARSEDFAIFVLDRTNTNNTITDDKAVMYLKNRAIETSGAYSWTGDVLKVESYTFGLTADTGNLIYLVPSLTGTGSWITNDASSANISSPDNAFVYWNLNNTQSNALTVEKIDLGTSSQAHTGLYVTGANAATGASLIKAEGTGSFSGQVFEGLSTGTSTASIQSSTALRGASFILEDVDGAGCTEITTLDGVISAIIITCP